MALLKSNWERDRPPREPLKLGEAVGLSARPSIAICVRRCGLATNNEVELRAQIQSVALEMRAYGYRPITKELQRRGVKVNHKRCCACSGQKSALSAAASICAYD